MQGDIYSPIKDYIHLPVSQGDMYLPLSKYCRDILEIWVDRYLPVSKCDRYEHQCEPSHHH